MRRFLQHRFSFISYFVIAAGLSACGGGGGSSSPGPTQGPTPTPTTTPDVISTPTPSPAPSQTPIPDATVMINGTVTYDFVPHRTESDTNPGALNYDMISEEPVRFATVALRDPDAPSDARPLAWTQTNALGQYSFEIGTETDFKVQILAELKSDSGAIYDIKVTDNVSGNALYVMESSVHNSGTNNITIDLHAPSGWTGSSYGEARTAAPFAILDSVWQAVDVVLDSEPLVFLPAFELRWSPRNIAVNGDSAEGDIGTSYFDGQHIYLLGQEDDDTDEYDRSVVQHELAHYLNEVLSRDDSIGGTHCCDIPTDMRVAFSEGSANAFTALVSGSGVYQDSANGGQRGGFRESLENNNLDSTGFYSEDTTAHLLYDLFDVAIDGHDTIELSMNDFFETIMDTEYTNSVAFTSLYLFTEVLRNRLTANEESALDDLLFDHKVMGLGIYGEGETEAANIELALPIYHELEVGGTVEVCYESAINNYNGLDVRRFVKFSVDQAGVYDLTAVRTSGNRTTNPQMYLSGAGHTNTRQYRTNASNQEVAKPSLTAGDYVLEIFDQVVVNDGSSPTYNEVCFDVSLSQ